MSRRAPREPSDRGHDWRLKQHSGIQQTGRQPRVQLACPSTCFQVHYQVQQPHGSHALRAPKFQYLKYVYNQIFQDAIRETLAGNDGAINVSDDFLVCSEFLKINSSNM